MHEDDCQICIESITHRSMHEDDCQICRESMQPGSLFALSHKDLDVHWAVGDRPDVSKHKILSEGVSG